MAATAKAAANRAGLTSGLHTLDPPATPERPRPSAAPAVGALVRLVVPRIIISSVVYKHSLRRHPTSQAKLLICRNKDGIWVAYRRAGSGSTRLVKLPCVPGSGEPCLP